MGGVLGAGFVWGPCITWGEIGRGYGDLDNQNFILRSWRSRPSTISRMAQSGRRGDMQGWLPRPSTITTFIPHALPVTLQ